MFGVFDVICGRASALSLPSFGRCVEALETGRVTLEVGGVAADVYVNLMVNIITIACKASLPQRSYSRDRPSMSAYRSAKRKLRSAINEIQAYFVAGPSEQR